jgi:succinate-semialdehyde dehydrogenase / glutarate-semialdehyde dehydrogenase
MAVHSVNPATDEVLATYDEMTGSQIETIIGQCHHAFPEWRRRPMAERSGLLRRVADRLRQGRQPYAEPMALETGKPVRDGLAEVEKCARFYRQTD